MNNKDREALDKFVDEDSLSPEDTKKFAEISDGERATFIAERFFEAGAKHGRSQLNEIRDDNMSELYDLIKKLKEENKKLVEALKFYADKNRSNSIFNPDYHDEEDCDFHEDTQFTHFGKLARQVLKEIGEE